MVTSWEFRVQNFEEAVEVFDDGSATGDNADDHLLCFAWADIMVKADKFRQNPIKDGNH